MDATRARRTRDRARQGWYARYRQFRFARYLGFIDGPAPLFAAVASGRTSFATSLMTHAPHPARAS
jgi:hypothetical protein